MRELHNCPGNEGQETTVSNFGPHNIGPCQRERMAAIRAFLQGLIDAGCHLIIWGLHSGTGCSTKIDADFYALVGHFEARFNDGEPTPTSAHTVHDLSTLSDADLMTFIQSGHYLITDRLPNLHVGKCPGVEGIQNVTPQVLRTLTGECNLFLRAHKSGYQIAIFARTDWEKEIVGRALTSAQQNLPLDSPDAVPSSWSENLSSTSTHSESGELGTIREITDYYNGMGGCYYENGGRWVRLTCTLRISREFDKRLLLSIPCDIPAPSESEIWAQYVATHGKQTLYEVENAIIWDRFLHAVKVTLPESAEAFLIWSDGFGTEEIYRASGPTLEKIKEEMAEREIELSYADFLLSPIEAEAHWGMMERIW